MKIMQHEKLKVNIKVIFLVGLVGFITILSIFFLPRNKDSLNISSQVQAQTSTNDWPQVQKDANHSGYVPQTVLPPTSATAVIWKRERPFPVSSRVQPIIAQNLVFLPSNNKNLYALSTVDGHTVWNYPTGGALVNSAAYDNGKVYIGSTDGYVYAVNLDGTLAWRFKTGLQADGTYKIGSVVKTAPVAAENKIFMGASDGCMYALNENPTNPNDPDTIQAWKHCINAPIYDSAAYDNGKVYFGGMDSVGYALNASNGFEVWHINIPGQGFRDRWTVAGNGQVFFTPMLYGPRTPFIADGTIMFSITANPIIYNQPWATQKQTILNYLATHPYFQPLHVIDQNTGQESFTPPVLYTGGSQSPHVQPVLLPNGNANVIYRRSFGEPAQWGATTNDALFTGELDLTNKDILPVDTCIQTPNSWDNCGNYKIPAISDESTALVRSGDIIYADSSRGTVGLDTKNKIVLPFSSYNKESGFYFSDPPVLLYPNQSNWICAYDQPFSEVNSDCNDIKRPTPIVGDTFYILHYSTIIAVKGTTR